MNIILRVLTLPLWLVSLTLPADERRYTQAGLRRDA